jgi:putative hydrolase of the HAD superfamily
MKLTTIAFDADDTLWENEGFFRQIEADVGELLSDYCSPEEFSRRCRKSEHDNIPLYGYGLKGFTLSMLEAAVDLSGRTLPADLTSAILEAGKAMLRHPIQLLPEVEETLIALQGRYRLLIITKGDLYHQEHKIEASGLAWLFDGSHVVSEKDPDLYRRIFEADGQGPRRSMMVGNSPKSDVLPAMEAGAFGVYVPQPLAWERDAAPVPVDGKRCFQIGRMGELERVLEIIETGKAHSA